MGADRIRLHVYVKPKASNHSNHLFGKEFIETTIRQHVVVKFQQTHVQHHAMNLFFLFWGADIRKCGRQLELLIPLNGNDIVTYLQFSNI